MGNILDVALKWKSGKQIFTLSRVCASSCVCAYGRCVLTFSVSSCSSENKWWKAEPHFHTILLHLTRLPPPLRENNTPIYITGGFFCLMANSGSSVTLLLRPWASCMCIWYITLCRRNVFMSRWIKVDG